MGGFPPQGAGGIGTGVASVDVIDRASRLLGIIYGSRGQQVLQRAATFELLVQLRNAGVDIDPRQIRFLDFTTDSVDISGSSVDVTDRIARVIGQLTDGAVTIDPRDRNWDLDFVTDQVDVSGSTINVVTTPTTPISDYNTGTIARNESNTHTYAVTGNFKLSRIEASAAGSIKIEIKAGNAGSETTKMVGFTSPSKPVIQLDFDEELQLSTGQNILIIRTNRENYDLDVYSTILGFNT